MVCESQKLPGVSGEKLLSNALLQATNRDFASGFLAHFAGNEIVSITWTVCPSNVVGSNSH